MADKRTRGTPRVLLSGERPLSACQIKAEISNGTPAFIPVRVVTAGWGYAPTPPVNRWSAGR
ncbi:MAG: hypothetical protein LBK73_02600 [Treponema sp.]|nr:hypothetical protein [Treponema sp.]